MKYLNRLCGKSVLLSACFIMLGSTTSRCAENGDMLKGGAAVAQNILSEHLFDRWDGKGKVDVSKAPAWWPSTAAESEHVLRSLSGVEVFEIGRSAGGRPIIAAAWGKREDLPGRTSRSLASATAGGSTSAFYGHGQRTRQSFVFVGNAHGLEFEGTVAALNMLNVVVTGKDLRGRSWPRLQRQGRQLRIVIIPHLNMDGRMRAACFRHTIGVSSEDHRRIFFGDLKDGRKLEWATSKLISPMPVKEVSPLGVYFNDHGINLVYDTGLGVDPEPETKALLSFLRKEMPDFALLSHTNQGSLVMAPDSFIPAHYQKQQLKIEELVRARCKREGAKVPGVSDEPQNNADGALYQSDLIYHTCGALPLVVEFPSGDKGQPATFDEILDVGMYALEEIIGFGVEHRFRPQDPRP